MSKAPWRVGRSLGRTLYQRVYTDHASKDDHFVGIMDSRELAQQVVDAVNAARESAQAIKVTDPGNLSGSLVADLQVELADILGVEPEGHSLTGDYAALRPDAERLARVVEAHTAGLEDEIARLRSINAELTNDAQCARDDQSFNLVCTIAAVLCDAEHGNGDMDGAMPHFDLAGRIIDAGAVDGHLQARENRISEMAEQIGELKHALARTQQT